MPKAIFNWKSKSRKISYMCNVCGKKYGTKQEACTCEWADRNGRDTIRKHNQEENEGKKEKE